MRVVFWLLCGWCVAVVGAGAAEKASPDIYRIAVLDEPSMPVEGCATPPETFERVLAGGPYTVTRLSADALTDYGQFNSSLYDLLVVPTGASFPLKAKKALLDFLHQQSDLLTCGGYAFDKPYVQENGKWVSYADEWKRRRDQARDVPVANGGFEDGPEGWQGLPAEVSTIEEQGAHSGKRCAKVCSVAQGGGSWERTLDVVPGQSYLVGAHGKAEGLQGPGYAFLAVYQYDAQGALVKFIDFAQYRQKTAWQREETLIEVAANATRVVFRGGLYLATGTLWIDDVTCAPLPRQEIINGHYGKPEDGLVTTPEQLLVFSPDQRITGVGLRAADGVMDDKWREEGEITGFEATVQLNQAARWTPLLEVYDRWGRPAGCAGARVTHSGAFTHSTWSIFGVDNRDVFAGEAGARLLRDTVRRMAVGVSFWPTHTDSPIHAPGEKGSFNYQLANAARDRRHFTIAATVRAPLFQQEPLFTGSDEGDISSGGFVFSALTLDIPLADLAYVEYELRVLVEGEEVDRISTGLCVSSPKTLLTGPRLRYADNAFSVQRDGKTPSRHCLFGTDTYASMFLSPTQSVGTWREDLALMRGYGLDLFENLQFPYTEKGLSEIEWLELDAMIQMAQAAGLPYMAGMLIGQNVAVSDEALRKQEAFCSEFAKRYRDTAGLIYYLNGDFTLELKDLPDLRRLWNEFLQARYGTDDALRAAWGGSAPQEGLGSIPVMEWPAQSWYDPHARDVAEFKISLTRRWLHALSGAVRSADRYHPITSEFYQRPYNGIDLRLAVDDLDVANIGYFDTPKHDTARLMAALRWNDMRWAGKSINVGEFGAKTHDAWAVERGGWNYHIQRTPQELLDLYWWMAHAGWAVGASKIQNWCWSDDVDRVFPWGLAWSNPSRPKPVLKMFRNLALMSRRVEPTYRASEVAMIMPDAWRTGAPEGLAYSVTMNALESLIATNVPFDVVNQADMKTLVDRVSTGTALKLAVVPLAYGMDDTTFSALAQLADTGVCVYVSGDPSIGADGKRRPERLEALCGVGFRGEHLNAAAMPVCEVEPGAASRVRIAGKHEILEQRHGQGRVLWSPDPWETLSGDDIFVEHPEWTVDAKKNLYLGIAERVGLEAPVRVKAKHGTWRALDTPSGKDRLLSLIPRMASERQSGVIAKFRDATVRFSRVAPTLPCSVLIDGEGQCRQASGSGELRLNGTRIVEAIGAWTAMSLDDQPLPKSRHMLVSTMAGGEFRCGSGHEGLVARLIDYQNGRMCAVAEIPVTRKGGNWCLETEPNELYLVTPSDEKGLDLLERLLDP